MLTRPNPPKQPGDGTNRVYEGVRRVIIEQTLAPGARLPEGDIAGRFRVSRTVVREAIARLVTDGLVERQHNRVARVASPTLAEADDLFATRCEIEALVIGRLHASLSAVDFEKLRAHIRNEKLAQKDRQTAVRLSGDFHILLAKLTGSQLLHKYVVEFILKSALFLTAQSTFHSTCCSPEEHELIIDVLQKGDLSAAQHQMSSHLKGVIDRARPVPPPAREFSDLPDQTFDL